MRSAGKQFGSEGSMVTLGVLPDESVKLWIGGMDEVTRLGSPGREVAPSIRELELPVADVTMKMDDIIDMADWIRELRIQLSEIK